MGGGYHGGFGHTQGALAQELKLVLTRPILIPGDEKVHEMPVEDNGVFAEQCETKPSAILTVTLVVIGEEYVPVRFWVGYFADILRDSGGDQSRWTGFTRDYYKKRGAFSRKTHTAVVDPTEYLLDISRFINSQFRYSESQAIVQDIYSLLYFAQRMKKAVRISVSISHSPK